MKSFLEKLTMWSVMASVFVVLSCSEENLALREEIALVNEDVLTETYFEDADDMAVRITLSDEVVTGMNLNQGPQVLAVKDNRFQCVTVVLTPDRQASQAGFPVGNIVIDFGNGCLDASGNVRTGKILIHFEGRRISPGSKIITRFENYSINDVMLSGTRTLANVSESDIRAPKFQVSLHEGKAVWPDGSVAARENCFVREWIRAQLSANDAMVISACEGEEFTAVGVNKHGKAYQLTLLEPLLYKRSCPIAVSGVKQFINVASGKVITIDYGSGTCDRQVSVTVDGATRSVTVGRKL